MFNKEGLVNRSQTEIKKKYADVLKHIKDQASKGNFSCRIYRDDFNRLVEEDLFHYLQSIGLNVSDREQVSGAGVIGVKYYWTVSWIPQKEID
jgi:hypothetical protein